MALFRHHGSVVTSCDAGQRQVSATWGEKPHVPNALLTIQQCANWKIVHVNKHDEMMISIYIYNVYINIYIYIYLSKLKSGERLTPPKANVCGERCARAVRACGARVRCARAVRDICAQWRVQCAIHARNDSLNPLLEHIRCIHIGSRLVKTPVHSFIDKLERMRLRL